MTTQRRLWTGLGLLLLASFGVLLWMGREIYHTMPPVPQRVVDTSGQVVYTGAQIDRGREVWQCVGGQQLGSIWGHGAYVAPDWSADWVHREARARLDAMAQQRFGQLVADGVGRVERCHRFLEDHAHAITANIRHGPFADVEHIVA